MSFLKGLFSGAGKDIIDSVGSTIDNLSTSDQEKSNAKNELTRIVYDGLNRAQETASSVILAEAKGNKLQRNWRPLLMLSFGAIILNVYFIIPLINVFVMNEQLAQFVTDFGQLDNFWSLLKLGIGGYIGGRSMEVIAKTVTSNVDLPFIRKKDRADHIK